MTATRLDKAIRRKSAVAIGPLEYVEFRSAATWLAECSDLECVSSLARVKSKSPDLVVLACPRRGRFTTEDVTALKHAFPLAHVVALVGSWCAGPWRREGDLLSGMWLVPWHQWSTWGNINLPWPDSVGCSSSSLPVTSTADDLAHYWARQILPWADGLVAIDARDRDTAEGIADALAM